MAGGDAWRSLMAQLATPELFPGPDEAGSTRASTGSITVMLASFLS